jgi:hypothetical protein
MGKVKEKKYPTHFLLYLGKEKKGMNVEEDIYLFII